MSEYPTRQATILPMVHHPFENSRSAPVSFHLLKIEPTTVYTQLFGKVTGWFPTVQKVGESQIVQLFLP